jgi:6-phosphogluconolactonase (cycloisomerase 2 family)
MGAKTSFVQDRVRPGTGRGRLSALAGWRGAWITVLGLMVLACGANPPNPVGPLVPATYVYAFEHAKDPQSGPVSSVSAYSVSGQGAIRAVGSRRFRETTGQWDPVVADPFGRFLFGLSNGIWSFPSDPATGAVDLARGSPFASAAPGTMYPIAVAPSGRFVYGSLALSPEDFGAVVVFRVDESTGALTEIAGSPFPAAVSPRRLWPSPDGRFLYVSDTNKRPDGPPCLSAYRIDASSGALSEPETSPYKTIAFVNQVEFHPSGRLLYATAGAFLLAYRIASDGSLESLPVPDEPPGIPQGAYVFSLAMSLDGRFLFAFELSGWILTYRVNGDTGELTFVSEDRGSSGFAACLLHPDGKLAVVLGGNPPSLYVHRIDAAGGLLQSAPPLFLGSEFVPTAKGSTLFLDSSGGIVCVVVKSSDALSGAVHLLTYRLDASQGTLALSERAQLGETAAQWVVEAQRGAAWPD